MFNIKSARMISSPLAKLQIYWRKSSQLSINLSFYLMKLIHLHLTDSSRGVEEEKKKKSPDCVFTKRSRRAYKYKHAHTCTAISAPFLCIFPADIFWALSRSSFLFCTFVSLCGFCAVCELKSHMQCVCTFPECACRQITTQKTLWIWDSEKGL